ncbi:hypothetical protein Nepgr_017982 [Nepenthes gracilis]|uniref:Uncharacterized protein n=1 Tax=Nepenthes gracilis TaxID=150966 RepID=A0AAD3XTW1_NEPGR|nr:hypothetical protein Nepgr_017982 [Nepenthes gracilis]
MERAGTNNVVNGQIGALNIPHDEERLMCLQSSDGPDPTQGATLAMMAYVYTCLEDLVPMAFVLVFVIPIEA